jgi:hypothetical protein
MCILINNDLIWLSVPKNASISIESAITNNTIQYEHYAGKLWVPSPNTHYHFELNKLKNHFGKYDTICVVRDWYDRWLSAFKYLFHLYDTYSDCNLKLNWEDIDNQFIYDTFTDENMYKLYFGDPSKRLELTSVFLENPPNRSNDLIKILASQRYWTSGTKCTYEFNTSQLHLLEEFISKRYSISFKIPQLNVSNDVVKLGKSKIDASDTTLKEFIWNKFEKPFNIIKPITLI